MTKRLVLFLVIGIFMISIVSAMEIDNWKYERDKTFDGKNVQGNELLEKYKPIEIKNAFGLGETLFEGYISQHDDACGEGCKSTIEINLLEDGVLIDEIIFKTLQKDDSWIEQDVRNYKFRYIGEIDNYEIQCNIIGQLENGTDIKDCSRVKTGSQGGWIDYIIGEEVVAGIYTLELEANKKPSRTVDWIIKTNGEWLESWATWGNISLGDEAEVILNSPDNNEETLVPIVNFNCSANVTNGTFLTNISLYTNQSGTWEVKNTTNTTGDFIPADGLELFLRMDNTTGSVTDTSGNGNDGENNGAIRGVDGILGNSFNLENVNSDFVNVSDARGLDAGLEISFNFWVNPVTSVSGDTLFRKKNPGGTTSYTVQWDASNTILVSFAGAGGTSLISSSTLPINDNKWTMVSVTYDDGDLKLYINGSTAGSNSVGSGTIVNTAGILAIGANMDTATTPFPTTFDGKMDEFSVYNKTLNQSEITALYNGGFAARPGFTAGITSSTQTWDRTISESALWSCEACDSDGDCGFATENRTLTTDITLPIISVESPSGTLNYGAVGNSQTLNVTFTDTGLDTCWFDYNGTNITIEGCLTGVKNSTQFILETDNLNMTIYANDTLGNLNSTFIEWNYTYFENNRTQNATSFQTASETFSINIEGATSASLFYNGTEYTATKSGDVYTKTIQIPVANLGNNSIYWRFDGTQNSFTSHQNISETVFGICNTTLTTTFLNMSFKDESDLSVINASIPSSTFVYWLGDGTVTKTLNFINNSNNFNYEFCATPNRTLNLNSLVQYKQGTDYPQRIYEQESGALTNATTNLTLYLLGTSDGLFVTFQVLNIAEQPVSGVDVTGTRSLEGSDTVVAQGTTDAAGSVTFWLNPDFLHTLTFVKTGLDTETLSIFPTQSAYTISMGGGSVTEPDQTRGVSLVIKPTDAFLLNGTIYNFNYTISSEFWNLDEFGFTLLYSNGTEIGTQTSTASSGGVISLNANTLNSSYITMNYYYLINTTYTNASRVWYVQNTEGSEYSIWQFFQNLSTYIDAGLFGFDDFGKALLSFVILVMVAGGLTLRYGIRSEAAIMGIIFGTVLLLDVGLGLIPNPTIATQSGVENVITIITGIILFGILIKEELR